MTKNDDGTVTLNAVDCNDLVQCMKDYGTACGSRWRSSVNLPADYAASNAQTAMDNALRLLGKEGSNGQ
jgi:hypothetical protein